MDVYEYINSKDIRAYLVEQNYSLTPVQCVFLVWQSKRHTLAQKHEAWKDIMDTLPDCSVPERINCRGWDSLHAMLRGYMALEQRLLSRFQSDEHGAVYEYEAWERVNVRSVPGDNGYRWNGGFRLFCSYDACYQQAQAYAKEENCRFRITKRYIDASPDASDYDPHITVEYDAGGNMMDVSFINCNFFSLSEEENALWNESFTGMWFDIPIPFKKGDIVCDNANIYTAGIPFVLLGTDPWYRQEHPQVQSDFADYSDMNAHGYSYDHALRFFNDDFRVDYLNLEHWTEPLHGPEKLLYAYSQFEKGKIDAYTLLKLYRMIQAEAAAEDERKMLKSYLRDDVWSKYYSL